MPLDQPSRLIGRETTCSNYPAGGCGDWPAARWLPTILETSNQSNWWQLTIHNSSRSETLAYTENNIKSTQTLHAQRLFGYSNPTNKIVPLLLKALRIPWITCNSLHHPPRHPEAAGASKEGGPKASWSSGEPSLWGRRTEKERRTKDEELNWCLGKCKFNWCSI